MAVNQDLLHQALVYHQANQRQGSSNTLTRGNVSGGGRKPFRQKGTGRARQGTIRAPHMRGGGVVFGPHPRSYRKRLPRRMRRSAIRMALSAKVVAERMLIVQNLEGIEPKTKVMAALLAALGISGSTLVVMRDAAPEAARAVRNLPRTKAVRAELLNVLDLLRYGTLVITPDAVQRAEELWSHTERLRPSTEIEEAAKVA
ncbi:MAG: 50S ribosomal protein L4 [Chloroflexi bacterium]|nr:50S ribosomal protein L4 [Chloroflexota bacterium]